MNSQQTNNSPPLNTLLVSGGSQGKIDFQLDWKAGKYFYRTKRSNMLFEFTVKKVGLTYRIYIDKQADYKGLNTGGHPTHRLTDPNNGKKYICIKIADEPDTIPEALTWLEYWSEATDFYITTGRSMDDLDKLKWLDSLS